MRGHAHYTDRVGVIFRHLLTKGDEIELGMRKRARFSWRCSAIVCKGFPAQQRYTRTIYARKGGRSMCVLEVDEYNESVVCS